MKVKTMTVAVLLSATLVGGLTACGGSTQKKSTSDATTKTEQVAPSVMSVDDVLAQVESLINKEVTLDGVCTHICQHGGKKLFLMGSDDTQTIRVESGSLGAFTAECVNAIVKVTGILKEQRIDEAYLQNWEKQAKEADEHHGDGEAGCSTEKQARGETANTTQGRIDDFRKKIAARKAKTGKEYLSFYFIEALSYEIEK